ncbi:hypothetical protein, partial [Escherichia coli]|uniref:hypothetical protein n=1 Tax=Escherichia coli TaxID=562 RepID=UPI00159BAB47
AEGKSIVVKDEHETDGGLGSIAVAGHEWCWSEMVDGVIAAFGLVTASMFAASDRTVAEIRQEFDERTKTDAAPEVSETKRRFVEAVVKAVVALGVADSGKAPRHAYELAEEAFFAAVNAGAAHV